MMSPYWEESYLMEISKASTYEELSTIAFQILNNMPQPIGQVCGPISTGGRGSIEANIQIFQNTIVKLLDEGHNIFDQTPFEKSMSRIRETYNCSEEEKNVILLEEFYRPVFESRLVKKTFFIHGWESSQGAKWEHDLINKLGIEKTYLPHNFLELQ